MRSKHPILHPLASILFASILGVGCSSSSETSSVNPGVLTGTYDAVTVNGSAPPVVLYSADGCTMSGISGALTPTAGGRFNASYTYRIQCGTSGENHTRSIQGSYTLDGSNLIFGADSGFNKRSVRPYLVSGTVNGATITTQGTPAPGMNVTMTLHRR